MNFQPWRRRFGAALVLFLFLGPSVAASPPTKEEIQQLVVIGSLLCTEAPAQDCVDHGWRFADADRNGYLDVEELNAVRAAFLEWAADVQGSLSGRERMTLNLARSLAGVVPLAPLFALYDENGDGELSQAELLADIQMDERPMATILADREATDWGAIRARLGRAAALLQMLGIPK